MKRLLPLLLALLPFVGICNPPTNNSLAFNINGLDIYNTNGQQYVFWDLAQPDTNALSNIFPVNWGGGGQFFVNAPGGTYILGPASIQTNTAAYPYTTNFTITNPAVGQYITNLTGGRAFFRGQVQCHMQSSTSAGGSAQFGYTPSNDGGNNFGATTMGLVGFGMITNQMIWPLNDILAPGDYFFFQTSTTGTGSFVLATNFSFTVGP